MSSASSIVTELRRTGEEWWGFMVYRTVYGNDIEWTEFCSACDELCANAFKSRYKEDESGGAEEPDRSECREKLRLQFVERPELDGADSDEVLDIFRQHCWAKNWSTGLRGRNQVCLMVDADVVRSVLAAKRGDKDVIPYFLAVDRNYDHGVKNTDYSSQNSDYAPNAGGNDEMDENDDDYEGGNEDDEPVVLKVKMQDMLDEFYINLLCDIQPDEMLGLSYVLDT